MDWISEHPYKMAVIVSILSSFAAAIIHIKQYRPFPEWDMFFLWLPVVWAVVFLVPVGLSTANKIGDLINGD